MQGGQSLRRKEIIKGADASMGLIKISEKYFEKIRGRVYPHLNLAAPNKKRLPDRMDQTTAFCVEASLILSIRE